VACNRVMGILSAVIATVANTATSVPIYICAALYVAMAAVAIGFPFEPYGKRRDRNLLLREASSLLEVRYG